MNEKLISADRLKQVLDKNFGHTGGAAVLEQLIDIAPAVDAVEVVRCYQCVNNPRIGTKTKGMVWCRKFRSEVRPDDFCSYGERREEHAVD